MSKTIPVAEIGGGTELARLAHVSRAAVSNWVRRNPPGWPGTVAVLASGPLFDLREMRVWLEGRDVRPHIGHLSTTARDYVRDELAKGTAVAEIARVVGCSRQTVYNVRDGS